MKPSDAVDVLALTERRWSASEWSDAEKQQFLKDIVPGERDFMLAAVDAIYVEGKDWAPSAGRLLRRAILLDIDPPSWEAVLAGVPEWRRVQDTLPPWVCPDGKCDGSGHVLDETEWPPIAPRCSCSERMLARRWEGLHPLIGEAVRRDWLNLTHLRDAAAGNTTRSAQLRAQWEEFVRDVVESRLLAQFNAVGLARLERAQEDTARRLSGGDAHAIGGDRGPARGQLASGAAGRLVHALESGDEAAA